MPEFFLVCFIVGGLVAVIGYFLTATDVEMDSLVPVFMLVVGAIVSTGGLLTLGIGAPHFAGKGDSVHFANDWVSKFRSGSDVECQPLDTDWNGYVTCTVSTPQKGAEIKIEAIECGVNRWYDGWETTGCKPFAMEKSE